MKIDGGPARQRVGDCSRAFLLRCWLEADAEPEREAAWRFSLTRIDTKLEIKGFASLEAVMAYLHQILIVENGIISEGEQS